MKLRRCIECDSMFEQKYSRQICCSPECSKKRKKTYNHTYNKSYSKQPKRKAYMKQYLKVYGRAYKKTDKYKNFSIKYNRLPAVIEKKKQWKKTEKYKEWQNKYNQSDSWKKSNRKWRTSPSGKIVSRMLVIRRRSGLNNVIMTFTKLEWVSLLATTKGVCIGVNRKSHYVGIDNLTLDHIYPISKANEDFKRTGIKRIYTIKDIQPLCGKCNSSKLDKITA